MTRGPIWTLAAALGSRRLWLLWGPGVQRCPVPAPLPEPVPLWGLQLFPTVYLSPPASHSFSPTLLPPTLLLLLVFLLFLTSPF